MTVDISNNLDHESQVTVINALLADITAIRSAVVAVTAKLDLDGGVTGTDFAATCNPAALTTVV